MALSYAPRTSPQVLARLRAEAQWNLDQRGQRSAYMAATMQTVLDTVNWIDGVGPAPLSGPDLLPDDAGLALEEARALDAERAARSEAMWRPGRVLLTLAYLAGDPDAESPV